MPVDLDAQLEARIRKRVETGAYQNTNEVISEALRLMDERDQIAHLRSLLAFGLDEADRGELFDLTPELLDEISREADEL